MPDPTPPDVQTILNGIFNAKDWRARVEEEVRNTAKVRRKNVEYKAEIDRLTALVPKDGDVMLKKADMDELTAFRALNLKPADIKALQTDHGTLKAKDDERTAEQQFAQAGEALGYANIPALTRFLKREGLVLDFKDVREKDEDSGKTIVIRMPVVRPKADEKAVFEPLDEYVEREVPEFVDVFTNAPSSDDDEEGDEPEEQGGGGTIVRPRVRTRHEQSLRAGVPIAGTPRARQGTGSISSKDQKTLQQAELDARNSGTYSV